MSEEMRKLLDRAGEEYPQKMVRGLCVSVASFIAEIDSSSGDVADYLEQRLGPVILAAYRQGGWREVKTACDDERKLRRK